ncbi:CRTAC1 family protein [Natronohydrobacter thiooxidans]|uniref:CRTAC1 family protein n=1 Tax=Natronohydrobacter thiooxidans TaxID=87172 RepID=UPI0008FF0946|nr:CRTAC1 family protein [Natronohydrobacter thiooxidans]
MRSLAIAAALIAVPALADPVIPEFTNETATAGLSTAYQGDWDYMVGGGVAAFDCSGNGFPDLFLAGGAGPSALYLNRSSEGGRLVFEKTDAITLDAVTGAYPLDIDGDGVTDLVVLRQGANRLLRGLGDCQFEDATEAWGFDGGDAWSTAFSATWETGADWPTLAIGNYIDRNEDAFPWGSCTENWLHRPDGRRFAPPHALTPSHCALSMLFTDWNRSGRPSLRVSNDREYYKGGQEQLWHIDPGQPPRLYTEEEGWQRLRIWGMGIAAADLTGNGLPEFFLTSMADNWLQVLRDPASGRPDYANLAFQAGVTAHRPYTGGDIRPSTAWHPQFADVNNDGRLDLFIAKGNVAEMPDFAADDPNNLLLQTSDGLFIEAGEGAGVASMGIARGAQLVDLNLDGQLDLVVVNRWTEPEIWRQTGAPSGNWLQIRLEQEGANRNAIGAIIEILRDGRLESHEVTSGGGHVSGALGWLHFGLGAAETVDLRVIWPDGAAGAWHDVLANGFLTLRRDAEPEPWWPE